jgi:hypothetical protein
MSPPCFVFWAGLFYGPKELSHRPAGLAVPTSAEGYSKITPSTTTITGRSPDEFPHFEGLCVAWSPVDSWGEPSMWNFVSEHINHISEIGAIASVIAAIMHSQREDPDFFSLVLVCIMAPLVIFVFAVNSFWRQEYFDFAQAISGLVTYGAALYAGICYWMRKGLAAYLTHKRGSKWIKEMDYVYLTLGAVGVVGSLNRTDLAGGHYTQLDLLGPLVLTTAIVIRLVKTRADIAGWNNTAKP